jgi:hypothetical protein
MPLSAAGVYQHFSLSDHNGENAVSAVDDVVDNDVDVTDHK